MDVENDAIGLVRAHRWANIKAQTKRLREDGCGQVLSLDEHKRADIERLARAGRTFKLLHAFLLAVPSRRGGMMADFEAALERIEKKGGVVKDVHTGLDSKLRPAFLAVVKDDVRRSRQGAKSALNGARNKPGRQLRRFTAEQQRAAKAIWRDLKDYPTWESAKAALEAIKTEKKEPFTMARAHRLWGKRQ